mmetsp:Transcript_23984/g.90597  ORF Transcript_23984/g.90597 Transcript_23984/m.90597 type:complete len:206 (-) Transcript_23984:228-845(-)
MPDSSATLRSFATSDHNSSSQPSSSCLARGDVSLWKSREREIAGETSAVAAYLPLSSPWASGEYPITPTSALLQAAVTSCSMARHAREYGSWLVEMRAPVATAAARSAGPKLDTPMARILPSSCSFLSSPNVAATSHPSPRTGQWIWYKSMNSVFKLASDRSTAARSAEGSRFSGDTLLARTTSSRLTPAAASALAMERSDSPPP